MNCNQSTRSATHWKRLIFAAALCIALCSAGPADARTSDADKEMGRRCIICHITADPAIEAGEETFYVPSGIEREQGSEAMCHSCHNGSVMDSRKNIWTGHQHPTGATPSAEIRMPKDFPLTDDNRLFCGTCHSPHEPTIKIEGRLVSNMRRPTITNDFCMECHIAEKKGGHLLGKLDQEIPMNVILSGGLAGPRKNKLTCRTCHLPHGSPERELLVRPKESLCEDCHGSNPSRDEIGPGMETHPTGVKAADELLGRRLPGGNRISLGKDKEVICLTCHKAHRPEIKESLLVAANTVGELCVHCHARHGGGGSKEKNNGNHPFAARTKRGRAVAEGCNICHRTHNGARDPFAEHGKIHLLSAPMTNSELCIECHKDAAAFGTDEARARGTHPIGVWAEIKRSPFSGGKTVTEREKLSCRSCHLSHGAEPGFSGLKEHRSFSCLLCHPDQNSLDEDTNLPGNHPIYVGSGKGSIPQEFLLAGGSAGEYGELVCRTCHGVHRAVKDSPLLLEPATRKDYCIRCHRAKTLLSNTKHDLNASAPDTPNKFAKLPAESGACGACHMTHGWARDVGEGPDAISRMCSDCHYDGSSVADPVGAHSHPICEDMGDRRNLFGLPLFTFDGKRSASGDVTCATCHDVHRETLPRLERGTSVSERKSERNFLRLPYWGTNFLCLNCHEEKAAIGGTSHDLRLAEEGLAPASAGAQAKNKGPCAYCHSPHNGAGAMMWARNIQETDDLISTLCTSCHSSESIGRGKLPQRSHPTSVSMPVGVGADLPLYDSQGREIPFGLVTCATCHDTHGEDSTADINTAGDGSSREFLRKTRATAQKANDASALCIHCHEEKQSVFDTAHDLRKGTCGGCHAPHSEASALMWRDRLKDDKDAASAACLGCHSSISGENELAEKAYSHPVGLAPEADTPAGLPLFDERGQKRPKGMITCATCHDAHAEYPTAGGTHATGNGRFQRIAGSPDRLCVKCHPKKANISGAVHDVKKFSPNLENILGQTPSEKGVCSACHVAHFAKDEPALWAGEYGPGEDMHARHCLGCHSEGGPAKNRIPKQLRHPKTQVAATETTAAKTKEGAKTFGGILKEILVGPVEPAKHSLTLYITKAMKFVDRLSISRNSPPLLPLYDDEGRPGNSGTLSCPSCHDIHDGEAQIRRAIFKEDSEREKLEKNLLRTSFVDEAARLCGDCHGPYRNAVFWGFHEENRGEYSRRIFQRKHPKRF